MTKGLNCSARALEHIPICYNYTSVAVRRVVADFSDLCNVLPVFLRGRSCLGIPSSSSLPLLSFMIRKVVCGCGGEAYNSWHIKPSKPLSSSQPSCVYIYIYICIYIYIYIYIYICT